MPDVMWLARAWFAKVDNGQLAATVTGLTVRGVTASEVDATFYGPNANELGGDLAIDTTATGFGPYDGVGTFILTNPTAN